jgi:hypothetical protein
MEPVVSCPGEFQVPECAIGRSSIDSIARTIMAESLPKTCLIHYLLGTMKKKRVEEGVRFCSMSPVRIEL